MTFDAEKYAGKLNIFDAEKYSGASFDAEKYVPTSSVADTAFKGPGDVLPMPEQGSPGMVLAAGGGALATGESILNTLKRLANVGMTTPPDKFLKTQPGQKVAPQFEESNKMALLAEVLKTQQTFPENVAAGLEGAAPYLAPGIGQLLFGAGLASHPEEIPGQVVGLGQQLSNIGQAGMPVAGGKAREEVLKDPIGHLMALGMGAGVVGGGLKLGSKFKAKKPIPPVKEAAPIETTVYHGTDADVKVGNIQPDRGLNGLYTTSSKEAAQAYGKNVHAFKVNPDSKVLDLTDGETLWSFMQEKGLLDKDQINNPDLHNAALNGELFQYDLNSKTRIVDDIVSTAKSMGADVVKIPDRLGAGSDNIASIVINKKVITPKEVLPDVQRQEAQRPQEVVPPVEGAKQPTDWRNMTPIESSRATFRKERVLGEKPNPIDDPQSLYRELSPTELFEYTGRYRDPKMAAGISDYTYMANTPDLALGQGRNAQGLLIEFDPNQLHYRVNANKPGWEVAAQNGVAEYVGVDNYSRRYGDAMRSITIRKGFKADKATAMMMRQELGKLEKSGWTKEVLPNGDTKYSKSPPAEVAPAPVVPKPGKNVPEKGLTPKQVAKLDRAGVGGEGAKKTAIEALTRAEKAAKTRLENRAKRMGTTLSANPIPELGGAMADYVVIGAAKIAKGTIEFGQWSVEMVKEYGEKIRPYLKQIYDGAQRYAKTDPREMVNLDRYDITPEAQRKLDQAVRIANENIGKNKGEILSHEEVISDAAKAEMLQKILTRDETKTTLGAFKKLDEHMAALAEKEAGTTGISKEFLEALETISAFGTDAGRRLEFQKAGTNAILGKLPEGDRIKVEFARKLQKLGLSAQQIIDSFKGVDWNNANQVTKAYRQLVPETFWDQLKEFRYGNMLSSPGTHIVNAVSNAIQGLVLRPAERATMGLADAVASTLSGKHRSFYIRQTPEYYRGAFKAMPQAISDAIATISGKKFGDRPDIGRLGTTAKWLAGHRAVLRTLEAADVFARTMVKAGETKALEYGNTRGGKQLTPEQIKAQAEYSSREATYRPTDDKTINQGHLGNAIDDLTKGVYSLRRVKVGGFEPLSWVIPFVETPMKIFKMGLQYTPAGYGFMPGSQMKMTQFSRATIGSTVTLGAAYLAFEGHTTWAAPRGKKERDAFYAAGKKPYSIDIPGLGQIQYNRLGPVGYPLALAAATQFYWQEDKNASANSKLEKVGNVVAAMGKFFSDQTYMQGIGDIVAAISGDKSQLAHIATSYPKQVVPFDSFMRWISSATDKYYRKADRGLSLKAIQESFMKDIPGLSRMLPPYPGEKKEPFAMATFPFWAPKADKVKQIPGKAMRKHAPKAPTAPTAPRP